MKIYKYNALGASNMHPQLFEYSSHYSIFRNTYTFNKPVVMRI